MDKVTEACHRIEELWNETNGNCYVSFSGGKDSTVLLALIKMCQELYTVGDIPAVFSNTGIELGVTVDFVKWVKNNWYKNVVVIHPVKPFDKVLKENGKPMLSKLKSNLMHSYRTSRTPSSVSLLIRGETLNGKPARITRLADKDMHMVADSFDIMPSDKCCQFMKKEAFKRYEKVTGKKGTYVGIRVEEGGVRSLEAKRRVLHGGKLCTYSKGKVTYKAPIIDWTDDDIEKFIEKYHIPLSEAYTKYGFTRTGCMACPYALGVADDLKYLYEHEPNRYKASMYWLKDVYIAQNVVLPFDQSYERERERMARKVRTDAAGNVA